MNIDVIYMYSSEDMTQIENKSVSLVVTSPPYNIDIRYGNKTAKGKVLESKGVKYSDNMDEDEYRTMLSRVFAECKRVVKDDGSIWVNIKNRLIDGEIVPPFWIQNFFRDMYLKNLIIWNFDWGGSTNKRFAPRYEFVFWFRFLYKGIIIKHNKTEPTYTKTSLFLCEKRRFLWPGLRKEGNLFKLAGPGGLAFFHLTKKEVSKWPMKK